MREPMFETSKDLENEIQVIKRFSKAAKLNYSKLPQNSLDFLLYDDKGIAKAFVEVKCYNCTSTQYPTQIHSLHKWEKMKTFEFLLPTYFVCRYSDGVILHARSKNIKGQIKRGGWKNPRPNSTTDREWVINIPKSLFKKLEG